MQNYLTIAQVIVSVLMIITILMQSTGSALGSVFGGDSNVYKSKRGMESFLHWASVVLAILFLGIAIVNLILQA